MDDWLEFASELDPDRVVAILLADGWYTIEQGTLRQDERMFEAALLSEFIIRGPWTSIQAVRMRSNA